MQAFFKIGRPKRRKCVESDMKKIAMAGVAAVMLAAAPAGAADLSRGYAAPAPYSPFSWTGAYAGANLGYQFGSVTNSSVEPNGFMGGGQIGYLWQNGQFVYGVETDLQASGADDTVGGLKFSNPWFGTLRGRVGWAAMSNFLFYGTGGLAYGGGKLETGAGSESHSHFGWSVGAGAEVALTPHWSTKVEYLFVNLNDERYALTGLNHTFESNLLRFGFNYRF
jgi:outer membrane immunogenic protein